MAHLTPRDRELVALGAAMGSNCVSCIEHHIPEAKRLGLSDAEITEAIELADKTRQIPARKTVDAALGLVADSHNDTSPVCGCSTARSPSASQKSCCG